MIDEAMDVSLSPAGVAAKLVRLHGDDREVFETLIEKGNRFDSRL